MTALVRIHRKGQMTLPRPFRTAIGVDEGDLVEASLWRGRIVLTPKQVIDRSEATLAGGDYTPKQRRVIDARLAKAEEDIRAGRTYGPFGTADRMIASMKAELKKRAAAKNVRRSR